MAPRDARWPHDGKCVSFTMEENDEFGMPADVRVVLLAGGAHTVRGSESIAMAGRQEIGNTQVIEALLQAIPDVAQLEKRLSSNPGKQLQDALDGKQPDPPPLPEAPPPSGALEPQEGMSHGELPTLGEPPLKPSPLFGEEEAVGRLGDVAHSALAKILKDGADAQLTEDEKAGAEAVVAVFGRPALLVKGGRFRPPVAPWEKLEEHRQAIETALKSVCRIELDGHPVTDVAGTGFVVADGVVITNRHVAKYFLALGSGPPWKVEPGITVRVDFNEEFLAAEPREHELIEVISVSTDVDMALLRVAKQSNSGQPLPPPLRVAGNGTPAVGSDVYVIGYPLYNPRAAGGNTDALKRIFGDVYGMKRVQPGQVRSLTADKPEIVHDCSTLNGNSGSCLIDLQTGNVVGLHRKGFYLEGNFAVALADVQDDPALQTASVVFS